MPPDNRFVPLVASLALSLLLLTAVPAHAAAPERGAGQFQDSAAWAERFDDARRDVWQKPDEVIQALSLAPDALVADIGAGTGYFAARLANAVPRGKVYAADLEAEMVRHLRERAAAQGLPNLVPVQAERASPNLPERVDLALLVNVQGLMVNPGDYFERLRSSLRPGGRVALIAWRPDSPIGAPVRMRVPPEHVEQEMVRQGYRLIVRHEFLPYQYFLVFEPRH